MSNIARSSSQHILLTGPPGVGKTTIVKKVCNLLNKEGLSVSGFYTEELRQDRQRIGFEVVTMDGKRGPLATLSANCNSKDLEKRPKVGQYSVDINSFESIALPALRRQVSVLVVDEIGKMEMFSERFNQEIVKVFKCQNIILATIPLPRGRPIPFIENLKKGPNVKVLVVNRENRNVLSDELSSNILAMRSSK